jgi:hypothetical protein
VHVCTQIDEHSVRVGKQAVSCIYLVISTCNRHEDAEEHEAEQPVRFD